MNEENKTTAEKKIEEAADAVSGAVEVVEERVEEAAESVKERAEEAAADADVVEVDNTVIMSVLSYLGILLLIPLLMPAEKSKPLVNFHLKQGIVLAIVFVAVWMVMAILPLFFILSPFVGLAGAVFVILGIINAVNKKQTPLPLIGTLATKFKI